MNAKLQGENHMARKKKPTIEVTDRVFLGRDKRGLDKFTLLAISKFEQLERLKRRCDELEIELKVVLVNVPDRDMGEYVKRTQDILETQSAKLEAFRKKWDRHFERFL